MYSRRRPDVRSDDPRLTAPVELEWLEDDLRDRLDEPTVRELERRIPVEALGAGPQTRADGEFGTRAAR